MILANQNGKIQTKRQTVWGETETKHKCMLQDQYTADIHSDTNDTEETGRTGDEEKER